jgi:hypothetical protein
MKRNYRTQITKRAARLAKMNKIADAQLKEMFDKIMGTIDAGHMAPEQAIDLRERMQQVLSGFLSDHISGGNKSNPDQPIK